jgi:hypothetical protein
MSIEDNKAIVERWFAEFWGPDHNPMEVEQRFHRPARVEREANQGYEA